MRLPTGRIDGDGSGPGIEREQRAKKDPRDRYARRVMVGVRLQRNDEMTRRDVTRCILTAIAACVVACSTEMRAPIADTSGAQDELHARVAAMIASGEIRFTGGDGSPADGPVVIEGTKEEFAGIAAEYFYIASKHGRPGIDWTRLSQLFGCDADRCFDTIEIEVAKTGDRRTYSFDITEFRPPERSPRSVEVQVSNEREQLQLTVSEPVLEVRCTRYPETMWAAHCSTTAGCVGSFRYGGLEFSSSEGPHKLTEGAYNCSVVAPDGASGGVAFCLNGQGRVGPCRRE